MKQAILSIILMTLLLSSCEENDSNEIPGPTEGLVAYFPFNGNANDESNKGNDGIIHGAVLTEDRFGESNKAYVFDGIDDCIKIGTMDSLSYNLSQFSISFWMKSDMFQLDKAIIGNTNDEGAGMHFAIAVKSDTNFVFAIRSNDNKTLRFLSDFSFVFDNIWHHIVIVVENSATNVLKFYIDNIEQEINITHSGSPENFVNFTHPFTIGAWNNRGTMEQYFYGSLDDIRIYSKKLDNIEVNNLFY